MTTNNLWRCENCKNLKYVKDLQKERDSYKKSAEELAVANELLTAQAKGNELDKAKLTEIMRLGNDADEGERGYDVSVNLPIKDVPVEERGPDKKYHP